MSGTARTGIMLLICIVITLSRITVQGTAHRPKAFGGECSSPADSSWIARKNTALLSFILDDEPLRKWLAEDKGLRHLLIQLRGRRATIRKCVDLECYVDGFSVPDSIAQAAGERIAGLWKKGNLLDRLLRTKVIPSGMYYQYRDSTFPVQLRLALLQDLGALRYMLSIYAGGKSPNYPLIDSISFDVHGPQYIPGVLYNAASVLETDSAGDDLFFLYSLRAALLFLELNGRDDPDNYEPMEQTVNREAVKKSRSVPWKSYPYTLILVPGAGPGQSGNPMSAAGMLRCRLAWDAWRHQKAPFIMVSGGKVHPFKTPFCEAQEMKNYLIKNLYVPPSAIIMEPHARHTTTNLRNAVRLIYRYHLPGDRPALVITDRLQAVSISTMAGRCIKELNYVPYRLGKYLSETTLEFYPLPEALRINPVEPLDP